MHNSNIEIYITLLKLVHYATREERASLQQITRGENGRPPEKHTILFFRPIIVNIIIVKKLWLGKKIVQW